MRTLIQVFLLSGLIAGGASARAEHHNPKLLVSTEVVDYCFRFPPYSDSLLEFVYDDAKFQGYSHWYGNWAVTTSYIRQETVRETYFDVETRRQVQIETFSRRVTLPVQHFSFPGLCDTPVRFGGRCNNAELDEASKAKAKGAYDQFRAQHALSICP